MWQKEEFIQNIQADRVFDYFEQISAIPRASFQEKAVSDFILKWAQNHEWECWQDDWNNVFIRKNASSGMEQAPVVMLQAHMDMVCQKADGISHDFTRDAIQLVWDGDFITTQGRTTLGADDGIGVALAMAVLDTDAYPHPELEVLFTSAEEEDMSGARNVCADDFHASFLLNLDNAVENHAISGSCGGYGVRCHWPLKRGLLVDRIPFYSITLRGLMGGHSGEDIHRGRGNAIILLNRILLLLQKYADIRLASFAGGTFRLAIPRNATACIAAVDVSENMMQSYIAAVMKELRQEYGAANPDLSLTAERVSCRKYALSLEDTRRFTMLVALSPDGIDEMNGRVPGLVQCSDNLGEIRFTENDDVVEVVFEIRAPWKAQVDYIYEKINMICYLAGGTCQRFSAYPGWPDVSSPGLENLAKEVYYAVTGGKLVVSPQHTGLECGCLVEKRPSMQALSIGPDCEYLHSPQERLSISSTKRIYQFITVLLMQIHTLCNRS